PRRGVDWSGSVTVVSVRKNHFPASSDAGPDGTGADRFYFRQRARTDLFTRNEICQSASAARNLLKMKAAVLYGKEDVRVEDVQPQPLKPGEVRIQIEAALTCGTDLKVFRRGYHAKMIVPPAVFGHELSGIISETQSPDWQVGDRAVVANSAPCGKC